MKTKRMHRIFAIVLVVALVMTMSSVAAQQSFAEKPSDAASSINTTKPSSTEPDTASGTDTTTPGSAEPDKESTKATTKATEDIGDAAQTKKSGIAKSRATRAVSTNVHFTKLEIHEGSPTGPLVADLLNSDAADMTVEQEYYLVATVQKDNPSDEVWVSIDMPYWMTPINMVGGSSWKTPGAAIEHTSIDKVVAFSAATGGSSAYNAGAGKVTYRIKDSAGSAGFAVSMKPNRQYYNGSGSQTVTAEKLIAACGDMAGTAVGAVVDSDSTTITKKSTSYVGAHFYNGDGHPAIAPGESSTDIQHIYLDNIDKPAVMKELEFDIALPAEADVTSIKAYGQEVEKTVNGSTTHCKVSIPSGRYGSDFLSVTASFPAGTASGNYDFPITNVTAKTYGDEHNFNRVGNSTLLRFVVKNDVTLNFSSSNINVFDWYGVEGVKSNSLLGKFKLSAIGSSTLTTENQTISGEFADNAIVRAFTVRKFQNPGDTITITAGGETKTWNLADVAKLVNTSTYAVIRNTDLGLAPETTIKAFTYEIGKLKGSDTSGAKDVYSSLTQHFGIYGSITDGNDAVNTYTLYETGTDPNDGTNTSVIKKAVKGVATTTLKIAEASGRPTVSKTALKAGDSSHVTGTYQIDAYTGRGGTTYYDRNPTIYLLLPEDLSYANLAINGTLVDGVEVTNPAAEADGLRIFEFESPEGTEVGFYPTDSADKALNVQYDLTARKSALAATYDLRDIMVIGSKDYPMSTVYGYMEHAPIDDKYNINDGRTLRGFLQQLITVQELKEIAIDNSMKVTKGSETLMDWMVYNPADPNNTRAFMNTGMSAEYKVSMANQTGENASDVEAFIPIPKKDQDFGDAFHPEGKSEFDLFFTDKTIPAGFATQYLKMNPGKTYDPGEVPAPADYTVASDPADADMIRIYATGGMADGDTADIIFDVDLGTLGTDDYGKINIWNTAPKYQTGSSVFLPSGSPEAIEIAGGTMSGTVYSDINGNGVMDGSETGKAGITVTATDTFNPARTLTTTTKADGTYEFDLVRNKVSQAGFLNSNTTVTIQVTNPDTGKYLFSPTTNTGNKPSLVTAAAGHGTASKSGIACTGTTPVVTDAGLVPGNKVTYAAGANGAITGSANEDILFGGKMAAVPSPNPNTGYHYTNWTLNKAVKASGEITAGSNTYAAGESIPAGTALTLADLLKVLVTEDLTATANFAIDTFTVTPSAGSNGAISPDTPQTVDYDSSKSFTMTPDAGYVIDTVTIQRGTDAPEAATPTIGSDRVGTYNLTGIKENTTIYVTFKEASSVEINYRSADADKGKVSLATEKVLPVTGSPAGSTATPAKGYHFVNWTNSNDDVVSEDATFTPTKTGGIYKAETYTAHFAQNDNITIRYASEDTARGTVSPTSESLAPVTGDASGSTATAKNGFVVSHWTNEDDQTVKTAAPGQTTDTYVPTRTGDASSGEAYDEATYTAHFTEKDNVTLTYASEDLAKGTVSNPGESLAPATGTADGAKALPAAGYEFVSWTNADDEIVSKKATFVPGKVDGVYEAGAYTAHFQKRAYTVRFDTNRGEPATVASIKVVYGDNIMAAAGFPADGTMSRPEDRTNEYTFLGWEVASGGAGTRSLTPGGLLESTDTMPASNVLLVASWEASERQDMDGLDALENLSVVKSADQKTVTPGANLSYTITVKNKGTKIINDVTVKDTLPNYTTYVSSDQGGVYEKGGARGTVTWNIPSLAPDESVKLKLTLKVDEGLQNGHTIKNTVVYQTHNNSGGEDPKKASNAAKSKITDGKAVQTGDEANIALYIGIALTAALLAAVALLAPYRRRRRNNG